MAKNPFIANKYEICWNLVNCFIASGLVLLGSLANGQITIKGMLIATVAGGIVFLTKFQQYWSGEKGQYGSVTKAISAFSFI